MMTDIEIAQQCRMHPIADIAATAGIDESYLEQYGRYKAKIDPQLLKDRAECPDGKLILVTAINPTPAGEGKTTTSVGLADGLRKIGKNAVAALREPSLGPVFGVKGGAAGGGYAQVVPMEDINLHFTGDFHAIGAANNLLAAMLDNHIQQGNALGIDVKQITWKRCVDMNDRQLRQIVDGLGGRIQGVPREDGFDITVASEVMAVLCLASDITDLKARLGRMIVAYTFDGKPVTAHDLKAEGAMTALLKDALKPNLVQTLEGTPTLIHGGPFANIAHGCNSVTATRMALKLGDYVVTEAGFGADLGAEKFLDIKCRLAGLRPNAVVIVATVRALKSHGGAPVPVPGRPLPEEYRTENVGFVEAGCCNLLHHINTVKRSGVSPVVCINAFVTDTKAEIAKVRELCEAAGARVALSTHWEHGGEGALELADAVMDACNDKTAFKPLYSWDMPFKERIELVAREVYGADGVDFSAEASRKLADIQKRDDANELGLCMVKTHLSLSDDPGVKGAPKGWKLRIRDVLTFGGAGFVVPVSGSITLMPGTGSNPSFRRVDVDVDTGRVKGIF